MARFYARFDGGNQSALDNTNGAGGYFNKRRIHDGSTAATALRNGLIASRSAISSDIYAELDAVNKTGNKGTYFPPDSGPFSSDYATYVSWSNVYTSSFNGIKTPTTNTYGVADSVNYSLRPTASVLSTDITIVGPASPVDKVDASYNVYKSASDAVRAVLDSIGTVTEGAVGTSGSPYIRLGNNSSRTLYSIWHDPGLNYFAWDDFTPGRPTGSMNIDGLTAGTPPYFNAGNPVSVDVTIKITVANYTFLNDGNTSGKIGFNVAVTPTNSSAIPLSLDGGAHGGPLFIGNYVTGNGHPGNRNSGVSSSWSWNNVGDAYTGVLTWVLSLTEGEYTLTSDLKCYDATITSSFGSTHFVTTFAAPNNTTNTFQVRAADGV